MKISTTALAGILLICSGCSNSGEPIEVVVKHEGNSDYTIRITVEGKEDVVIDDPYESQIREISRAFAPERENFIRNRSSMSSEERKSYGRLRDETAAKIRELDKMRRSYIRAQLQEHGGIGFVLQAKADTTSTEKASDYLESLEN